MASDNMRKAELLGMPFGTASGRLRKSLLFAMANRLGEGVCFRCGKVIVNEQDFSIEHKSPWASSGDPIADFFDLDNIAFSHLTCNVGAAARPKKYADKQERHREKARRRNADPVMHEAFLTYRRDRYQRLVAAA